MVNSKFEIRSSKQIRNSKRRNSKLYDLEERTLNFSYEILRLCKSLPFNIINKKLIDQLVRSGTSIGANYREANETDTKKDFKNRIRIAKKEAKETQYWLKLIAETNSILKTNIEVLLKESEELMKILGSIYEKTK